MKKYTDYLQNISGKILLGCDGFVDETYEIVEVRRSQSDFTAMKKLRQFGELLVERADGGVGLELVPKRRCEGGFAINTGRVAAFLGLKPSLPGLYGNQSIDPAYHEFEENCNLLSLGDPALTIALEFSDGKVLMSNLEAVSNLTWEQFKTHFGDEKLKEMFTGVDILGLGYWSLTADFDKKDKTRNSKEKSFAIQQFAFLDKKKKQGKTKKKEKHNQSGDTQRETSSERQEIIKKNRSQYNNLTF